MWVWECITPGIVQPARPRRRGRPGGGHVGSIVYTLADCRGVLARVEPDDVVASGGADEQPARLERAGRRGRGRASSRWARSRDAQGHVARKPPCGRIATVSTDTVDAVLSHADDGTTVVATNRPARRNFFIEDTFEAGIVLRGQRGEVAARVEGAAQSRRSASLDDGEMWLHNLHIAPVLARPGPLRPRPAPRPQAAACTATRSTGIAARLKQERLSLVPLRAVLQGRQGQGRARPRQGQARPSTSARTSPSATPSVRPAGRSAGP